MRWGELIHPQEEGQQELGQVGLLPLGNCLLVAEYLLPYKSLISCILPHKCAVDVFPSTTDMWQEPLHRRQQRNKGNTLSPVESVREGTLK